MVFPAELNGMTDATLAAVHVLAFLAATLLPFLLAVLVKACSKGCEDWEVALLMILPGFFGLVAIIWGWAWTVRLAYLLIVLNI